MAGFFPAPYRDELLYSVCARYQDYLGYENKLFAGQELFGGEKVTAVVDLPCRLRYFVTALPRGHSLSVDRLVYALTLFPYFRPFLGPERERRARHSMKSDEGLAAKVIAGSAANSVCMPPRLRFCPSCVKQDRRLLGETYWRRVHQLPGVEVCPEHLVFLEDSMARVRSRHNPHEYISAERGVSVLTARQVNPSDPTHQRLTQLAHDTAWLLNQRGQISGLHDLRQKYLHLLYEKGLASYGGRIRAKELTRAVENYYSPELLHSLGCGINRKHLSNWLSVFSKDLGKNKFQHPLRHLLLIQMLGHSAESFFSLQPASRPFGSGPWPCLNPVCKCYRQPVIRDCSVSPSISIASGKRIKVLAGTFVCGCGFTYRRRNSGTSKAEVFKFDRVISYGPTWEGVLAELWRDSSLTLEDIALQLCGKRRADERIKVEAARLGLSFPRRYKTCRPARERKKRAHGAATPGRAASGRTKASVKIKRSEWLHVLSQNPTAMRTNIRNRFSSLYKWLNVNDHEWLLNHLPPRRDHHFDWASLDKELSQIVAESAERLRRAVPPRRITIFALGQDTGCYDYLRKQRDRLPNTTKVMERLLESRLEFTKRKLRVIAESVRDKGRFTTRNDLLKLAGVSRDLRLDPDVSSIIDDMISPPLGVSHAA